VLNASLTRTHILTRLAKAGAQPSLVVAVPAMITFLVVQRYIVAGLAAGSLKG
jgi:ABC-type maltose transport system permease subunit